MIFAVHPRQLLKIELVLGGLALAFYALGGALGDPTGSDIAQVLIGGAVALLTVGEAPRPSDPWDGSERRQRRRTPASGVRPPGEGA